MPKLGLGIRLTRGSGKAVVPGLFRGRANIVDVDVFPCTFGSSGLFEASSNNVVVSVGEAAFDLAGKFTGQSSNVTVESYLPTFSGSALSLDNPIAAWFNADSGITTVSGLVSNWAASGDDGAIASQSTIGSRPSYTENNEVYFGEASTPNDWLDLGNAGSPLIPATGDWIIGIVGDLVDFDAGLAAVSLLTQYVVAATGRFNLAINLSGNGSLSINGTPSLSLSTLNSTPDGTYGFYLVAYRNGTEFGISLNGAEASTATSSISVQQTGNLIGGRTDNTTTYNDAPVVAFPKAKIKDLIVVDGYSSGDLAAVSSYLSGRTPTAVPTVIDTVAEALPFASESLHTGIQSAVESTATTLSISEFAVFQALSRCPVFLNWRESYTDTAATTAAVTSDAVAGWKDWRAGLIATQSDGAAKPTRASDGLALDGSADFITLAHNTLLNLASSGGMVVRYKQSAGFRVLQKGTGLGTEANTYFMSPTAGAGLAGGFEASFTANLNTLVTDSFWWNGTVSTRYRNGTKQNYASPTGGTAVSGNLDPTQTFADNTDSLFVGKRDNASSGILTGTIQTIAYIASDSDRPIIETFVSAYQ